MAAAAAVAADALAAAEVEHVLVALGIASEDH